jgi:hypothetical protein
VAGIVFALLAALGNAVSVITRHIASTADPDRPAGWRLAGYLLRNSRWLAGWAAQIGAFAFQAVALEQAALQSGPLRVSQPGDHQPGGQHRPQRLDLRRALRA